MQSHSIPYKIISLLVLVCFITNTTTSHALPLNSQPAPLGKYEIKIPQSLGVISESYVTASPGHIVIIQDRHADELTQKNIFGIIDKLINEYEFNLVCLEGASQPLDARFYDAYPNDSIKDKIARFFLKKAVFTGAEFYRIIHPDTKAKFIGAENSQTYLKHLSIFNKPRPDQAKVLNFLETLESFIEKLKIHIYSTQLIFLDKKIESYNLGDKNLSEFIKDLAVLAQKQKISLEGYTEVAKFRNLAQKEKHINFSKAETQRADAINKLSKLLSETELKELLEKSINFRLNKTTEIEFYSYLVNLIQNNKEKLSAKGGPAIGGKEHKFDALLAYCDYIKASSEIDTFKLFRQVDLLKDVLRESLFKNEKQRALSEIDKQLNILKDLIQLKLTPDNYEYYLKNKEQFNITSYITFLQTYCPQYNIPLQIEKDYSAGALIKDAEEFYSLASQRDKYLAENTLKLTSKEPAKSAVLVAGGFHTKGITDILKEKGISYTVVLPRINEEFQEALYQDRMKQKPISESELSEILQFTIGQPLGLGDASADAAKNAQSAFSDAYRLLNMPIYHPRTGLLEFPASNLNLETPQREIVAIKTRPLTQEEAAARLTLLANMKEALSETDSESAKSIIQWFMRNFHGTTLAITEGKHTVHGMNSEELIVSGQAASPDAGGVKDLKGFYALREDLLNNPAVHLHEITELAIKSGIITAEEIIRELEIKEQAGNAAARDAINFYRQRMTDKKQQDIKAHHAAVALTMYIAPNQTKELLARTENNTGRISKERAPKESVYRRQQSEWRRSVMKKYTAITLALASVLSFTFFDTTSKTFKRPDKALVNNIETLHSAATAQIPEMEVFDGLTCQRTEDIGGVPVYIFKVTGNVDASVFARSADGDIFEKLRKSKKPGFAVNLGYMKERLDRGKDTSSLDDKWQEVPAGWVVCKGQEIAPINNVGGTALFIRKKGNAFEIKSLGTPEDRAKNEAAVREGIKKGEIVDVVQAGPILIKDGKPTKAAERNTRGAKSFLVINDKGQLIILFTDSFSLLRSANLQPTTSEYVQYADEVLEAKDMMQMDGGISGESYFKGKITGGVNSAKERKPVNGLLIMPVEGATETNATPGNRMGKLFRKITETRLQKPELEMVTKAYAREEEEGTVLAFYADKECTIPLYTKDGNIARVRILPLTENRPPLTESGQEIKIIEDNENIRGFADASGVLYLAQSIASLPENLRRIAIFHERGEAHYADPNAIPTREFPKLPEGVNAHKFLIGGGKRLRTLVRTAIEQGALTKNFIADDVTQYIREHKSELNYTDQDIKNEIALIRYNASQGKTGIELLYGLQDTNPDIGPEANSRFSEELNARETQEPAPAAAPKKQMSIREAILQQQQVIFWRRLLNLLAMTDTDKDKLEDCIRLFVKDIGVLKHEKEQFNIIGVQVESQRKMQKDAELQRKAQEDIMQDKVLRITLKTESGTVVNIYAKGLEQRNKKKRETMAKKETTVVDSRLGVEIAPRLIELLKIGGYKVQKVVVDGRLHGTFAENAGTTLLILGASADERAEIRAQYPFNKIKNLLDKAQMPEETRNAVRKLIEKISYQLGIVLASHYIMGYADGNGGNICLKLKAGLQEINFEDLMRAIKNGDTKYISDIEVSATTIDFDQFLYMQFVAIEGQPRGGTGEILQDEALLDLMKARAYVDMSSTFFDIFEEPSYKEEFKKGFVYFFTRPNKPTKSEIEALFRNYKNYFFDYDKASGASATMAKAVDAINAKLNINEEKINRIFSQITATAGGGLVDLNAYLSLGKAADSRGESGEPNYVFSGQISLAIDSGNILPVLYRHKEAKVDENFTPRGASSALKLSPDARACDLTTLNRAILSLSQEDRDILEGFNIIFYQGATGGHYSLPQGNDERKQVFINAWEINDLRKLIRQLHHEIQERNYVVTEMDKLYKDWRQRRADAEIYDKITKLSRKKHIELRHEERLVRNLYDGKTRAIIRDLNNALGAKKTGFNDVALQLRQIYKMDGIKSAIDSDILPFISEDYRDIIEGTTVAAAEAPADASKKAFVAAIATEYMKQFMKDMLTNNKAAANMLVMDALMTALVEGLLSQKTPPEFWQDNTSLTQEQIAPIIITNLFAEINKGNEPGTLKVDRLIPIKRLISGKISAEDVRLYMLLHASRNFKLGSEIKAINIADISKKVLVAAIATEYMKKFMNDILTNDKETARWFTAADRAGMDALMTALVEGFLSQKTPPEFWLGHADLSPEKIAPIIITRLFAEINKGNARGTPEIDRLIPIKKLISGKMPEEDMRNTSKLYLLVDASKDFKFKKPEPPSTSATAYDGGMSVAEFLRLGDIKSVVGQILYSGTGEGYFDDLLGIAKDSNSPLQKEAQKALKILVESNPEWANRIEPSLLSSSAELDPIEFDIGFIKQILDEYPEIIKDALRNIFNCTHKNHRFTSVEVSNIWSGGYKNVYLVNLKCDGPENNHRFVIKIVKPEVDYSASGDKYNDEFVDKMDSLSEAIRLSRVVYHPKVGGSYKVFDGRDGVNKERYIFTEEYVDETTVAAELELQIYQAVGYLRLWSLFGKKRFIVDPAPRNASAIRKDGKIVPNIFDLDGVCGADDYEISPITVVKKLLENKFLEDEVAKALCLAWDKEAVLEFKQALEAQIRANPYLDTDSTIAYLLNTIDKVMDNPANFIDERLISYDQLNNEALSVLDSMQSRLVSLSEKTEQLPLPSDGVVVATKDIKDEIGRILSQELPLLESALPQRQLDNVVVITESMLSNKMFSRKILGQLMEKDNTAVILDISPENEWIREKEGLEKIQTVGEFLKEHENGTIISGRGDVQKHYDTGDRMSRLKALMQCSSKKGFKIGIATTSDDLAALAQNLKRVYICAQEPYINKEQDIEIGIVDYDVVLAKLYNAMASNAAFDPQTNLLIIQLPKIKQRLVDEIMELIEENRTAWQELQAAA